MNWLRNEIRPLATIGGLFLALIVAITIVHSEPITPTTISTPEYLAKQLRIWSDEAGEDAVVRIQVVFRERKHTGCQGAKEVEVVRQTVEYGSLRAFKQLVDDAFNYQLDQSAMELDRKAVKDLADQLWNRPIPEDDVIIPACD